MNISTFHYNIYYQSLNFCNISPKLNKIFFSFLYLFFFLSPQHSYCIDYDIHLENTLKSSWFKKEELAKIKKRMTLIEARQVHAKFNNYFIQLQNLDPSWTFEEKANHYFNHLPFNGPQSRGEARMNAYLQWGELKILWEMAQELAQYELNSEELMILENDKNFYNTNSLIANHVQYQKKSKKRDRLFIGISSLTLGLFLEWSSLKIAKKTGSQTFGKFMMTQINKNGSKIISNYMFKHPLLNLKKMGGFLFKNFLSKNAQSITNSLAIKGGIFVIGGLVSLILYPFTEALTAESLGDATLEALEWDQHPLNAKWALEQIAKSQSLIHFLESENAYSAIQSSPELVLLLDFTFGLLKGYYLLEEGTIDLNQLYHSKWISALQPALNQISQE